MHLSKFTQIISVGLNIITKISLLFLSYKIQGHKTAYFDCICSFRAKVNATVYFVIAWISIPTYTMNISIFMEVLQLEISTLILVRTSQVLAVLHVAIVLIIQLVTWRKTEVDKILGLIQSFLLNK
jgi:hypothetical protein